MVHKRCQIKKQVPVLQIVEFSSAFLALKKKFIALRKFIGVVGATIVEQYNPIKHVRSLFKELPYSVALIIALDQQ